MNKRSLKLQKYKRFNTNIPAILKKITTDETQLGLILNMSKGGVFIKCKKGEMTRGEILELTVFLGELSKSHRLLAEVVWSSPPDSENKGEDLYTGLRFMTPENIYNRYLNDSGT